ncbi:hypothetical protein ACS0TY_003019 [Phlomoides rotata]
MENEKCRRAKVHSKLSVVSGKPTEPGKIHKFSAVDRAMGLHTVHAVFYYGSNPFQEGPLASDLDNLRVTLSQLLDQYPVVTGRLERGPDGAWQVKCTDAGVRMLQANVSVTLDEWLTSADASEERDLTVWEEMPHDPIFWSPFRIQVSNFKCGGLAIGLSCTHMHADITSATMLIRSWTEVHRGLPSTHPPIFHLPPLSPSPSISINPSYSFPTNCNTPSKLATATMKFPASTLKKRLSQLRTQCPDATPFDVLAALFWSCIASHQQDAKKRAISICVDSRSLPNSPISYAYFGNALRFSTLGVDAGDLVQDGGRLGKLADLVHRHVAGLKADDFVAVVGDGPHGMMYGPRLTCIDAEHLVDETGEGLMYGAVFGPGGKPVHVSYHVGNVEGEGLIWVMPSAEGGLGRTVTVTLPEEQMTSVCKDEGILELEPSMVLSGERS